MDSREKIRIFNVSYITFQLWKIEDLVKFIIIYFMSTFHQLLLESSGLLERWKSQIFIYLLIE